MLLVSLYRIFLLIEEINFNVFSHRRKYVLKAISRKTKSGESVNVFTVTFRFLRQKSSSAELGRGVVIVVREWGVGRRGNKKT